MAEICHHTLCLTLCYFVLVFFSPFSIVITSLGEESANLSVFRCFSICACLVLSVSSSSWCQGRAAVYNCGTPWTFLLSFFLKKIGQGGRGEVVQRCGQTTDRRTNDRRQKITIAYPEPSAQVR